MHANGGHDQLDGLRLNACIAWKSCQHKIWTGLSSTGPWPSATCTGHAGSSFLGHVNTYHHTSPCALSWCSACMSKTLVHVATHKLGCCWLIDRSEVCHLCAGDRMQRLRLCVFQRTSVCSMDLLGQPCNTRFGLFASRLATVLASLAPSPDTRSLRSGYAPDSDAQTYQVSTQYFSERARRHGWWPRWCPEKARLSYFSYIWLPLVGILKGADKYENRLCPYMAVNVVT